ncbi:MAG: crotonobetainyl-CoA--carnitine CoA-transferase [Telmatospirillum sp.]|nr:crotonobetainyl-CoA--carnitine CoA-transferase [Telmatospirillum sp.]
MSDVLNRKSSVEQEYLGALTNARQEAQKYMEPGQFVENTFMFLTKKEISHILFFYDLYAKHIVNVHGNIYEFGARFGRNLVLFTMLRGLLEPFNFTRKVIGFDTFSGFPSVHGKDGEHSTVRVGAYGGLPDNYPALLAALLAGHESDLPIPHLKKFDIVIGDINQTSPQHFAANPADLVALAYFDVDLYEPTKIALTEVLRRSGKGTVLVFDEVNAAHYPGETVALLESCDIKASGLQRNPLAAGKSFIVLS